MLKSELIWSDAASYKSLSLRAKTRDGLHAFVHTPRLKLPIRLLGLCLVLNRLRLLFIVGWGLSINGKNLAGNQSGISLLGIVAIAASLAVAGVTSSGCGGGGGGHANSTGGGGGGGRGAFSIDIDAPAQVDYDVAATFSVIPSGASGAVTYSLTSAPQGMTIDSASGTISWTPAGLRFAAFTDYTFTVSASDGSHTANDSATVTVDAGTAAAPVVRSSAKVPIKHNSIFVADFNGDGENEVITTDNKNLIYTLVWDTSAYRQDWVNPYGLGNGAAIDAIAVGDVNGDNRVDIVALNGGVVSVIDGAQQRVRYTTSFTETTGKALAVADLNADGIDEIVAFVSAGGGSSDKVYVLNAPSSGSALTTAWSSVAGDYGTAMAVGNVDADSQLEIVLQNATVIDSVSHQNQWRGSPASNFGDIIQIANLNAKDENEIIGLLTESPFIVVYSAQVNSDLIGRNNPFHDPETSMCALWAGDLSDDGSTTADDGFAEIVVGICAADGGLPGTGEQVEHVQVLNIENLGGATAAFQLKQDVSRPAAATDADTRLHGGFMSFAVGDTDNDGTAELVWANLFSGTESDAYDSFSFVEVDSADVSNVLASDVNGLIVEAQTKQLGIIEGKFIGAVDMSLGAGSRVGMFGSYSTPAEGDADDKKYGDHLVAFDFGTKQLQLISGLVGRADQDRSMYALKAADVLGTGYDQLVMSTSDFNGNDDAFSTFFTLDIMDTVPPPGFYVSGILAERVNGPIALTDINLDTHDDVIGVIDSQLRSYNLFASGSELWRSIPLFDDSVDIEVANLDADIETELLVLTKTLLEIRDRRAGAVAGADALFSNIFLFSASVSGANFTAVAALDIDANGTREIYVSDATDASSTVLSVAMSGTSFGSFTIAGQVDDMLADTVNGQLLIAWSIAAIDGAPKLSYISAYDGVPSAGTWTEVWRSPALNGKVMLNSMNFTSDGQLLIGTESAVYLTQ